jgi:hypothetical protein
MTSRKHDIIIGLDSLRAVRATQFLPGLIVHKSADCPPGKDFLNVTHAVTGLAVAIHLQPGDMLKAKEILAQASWTVTPDILLESEEHRLLSERVMSETNRARSLKQEKRIAKDTGGKRQPASGARWGARRDVVLPRFKIEAKTTKHSTFSVDVRDLGFLKQQAYLENRIGVYIIELDGKEELCIIPKAEADDELLAEATIKKIRCAGERSFTVTVAMSNDAVRGAVYELESASGMYYCFSYERFLKLAKRGMDGT